MQLWSGSQLPAGLRRGLPATRPGCPFCWGPGLGPGSLHSLSHFFIRSFPQSFHSFIHSFIPSLTHSLTLWLRDTPHMPGPLQVLDTAGGVLDAWGTYVVGGAATDWIIKQRTYSCAKHGGGGEETPDGVAGWGAVGSPGRTDQLARPATAKQARRGECRHEAQPLLGPQRQGKARGRGTGVASRLSFPVLQRAAISSVAPGHLVPAGGTREPEKTLPPSPPDTE